MSTVADVTVLLPCYLPNEQGILRDTIAHIIEEIDYPSPFELILCYNTPKPLPIEEELAALDEHTYENGRTLRVLKVEGSRSKAENLNAALGLVKTENVIIYDADHHADRNSLMLATQYMKLHGCACVQGSTYIRYKPTLLARVIDAEFFVIFFCFFPAIQFLTRVVRAPPRPAPTTSHPVRHPPTSRRRLRRRASSAAPTRCGRPTCCASTSSVPTSPPRTSTSRRGSSWAT